MSTETILIVTILITGCFCAVAKCASHLSSTDRSKLDVGIFWTLKFISELKLSPLSAATSLDVDSASDLYRSTFSGILDKMIPFKTVRIHKRPSDPWFDRECRTSKFLKRSLERIYIRTKSENDFAAWLGQKKLYKRLCRHKRRDNWKNELNDKKNG